MTDTNYNSVINTAKNNKLIRAELREIVLSLGLVFGLSYDKTMAEYFYPNNKHRQKQFTYLKISNEYLQNEFLFELINVLKHYYKYVISDNYIIFYDTKKFRIYRKRLEYGQDRKIRLNKIMRYFWTFLFVTVIWETKIPLNQIWCINKAYDYNETIEYLNNYINKLWWPPGIRTRFYNNKLVIFPSQKEAIAFYKKYFIEKLQKGYEIKE